MFGIGAGEFVIILIAALVIFGPGKLPEVGRAIGKGLREFKKAQAAFSATLDEVSAEPKKNTAEEKKVTLEKKSEENVESEKNSVSVENVINMAKKNPLNKEKINEKISNGNDYVADNSDVGKRVESARSNSDGTGK